MIKAFAAGFPAGAGGVERHPFLVGIDAEKVGGVLARAGGQEIPFGIVIAGFQVFRDIAVGPVRLVSHIGYAAGLVAAGAEGEIIYIIYRLVDQDIGLVAIQAVCGALRAAVPDLSAAEDIQLVCTCEQVAVVQLQPPVLVVQRGAAGVEDAAGWHRVKAAGLGVLVDQVARKIAVLAGEVPSVLCAVLVLVKAAEVEAGGQIIPGVELETAVFGGGLVISVAELS